MLTWSGATGAMVVNTLLDSEVDAINGRSYEVLQGEPGQL